nr:DUF1062 domain-containing protein [Azospirillum argentinense]
MVRPIGSQRIVKRCPGCDAKRSFVSSGAFRVNAQKKSIDVWHIYKCEQCSFTWNIEIISRTNRSSIDPVMYDRFLRNDPEESRRQEFNYSLLSRLRAELGQTPDFTVDGPGLKEFGPVSAVHVRLGFEFLLPVRLMNVVTQKLMLSRRRLTLLIDAGRFRGLSRDDLQRKVNRCYDFEFEAPAVLAEADAHCRMSEVESSPSVIE